MPAYDIFSKRQKKLRGEVPDVYAYDEIPKPLRVQMLYIIRDATGKRYSAETVSECFEFIHDTLCREHGLLNLVDRLSDKGKSIEVFLLQEPKVELVLDAIELCFKLIDLHLREIDPYFSSRSLSADEAVEELNLRFKEHGVGYQYVAGGIIRMDSAYVHSEVVKPALVLLGQDGFAGANDEFRTAHDHYRHRRYKECLVECLKAFESTMKSVCKRRGWMAEPGATAARLVEVCLENQLFPRYLETQMGAVRTLLTSGVPTIRNKSGGHGQGSETVKVPDYLARYCLNLTATTALLLMEADSEGS
ncbi:STM4504/CBY_0614 family protein [Eleftheria terrae]|uniref:STM4504/CBY_0614 family protein n=1 Tax=Eleftheria terrae TaxID=1597781 RepID=UPI00263A4201|nr:hypothetical protein [Eleftheria terrae]WKB55972.1 hypothetical protein N7L95_28280 [Eleftheria terrae]